jgi:hypothetical protein
MNSLILPDFQIGMVVTTPTSTLQYLTEDKKYIIQDVEDEWIMVTNDINETRYYRAHLFIETNVYYNMIMYLTLIRLFDLPTNPLK